VSSPAGPGHWAPGRLLHRGRVGVIRARRGRLTAVVGDRGLWTVELKGNEWSCSCPLTGTCNHIEAVGKVAALYPSDRPRRDEMGDDDECPPTPTHPGGTHRGDSGPKTGGLATGRRRSIRTSTVSNFLLFSEKPGHAQKGTNSP